MEHYSIPKRNELERHDREMSFITDYKVYYIEVYYFAYYKVREIDLKRLPTI